MYTDSHTLHQIQNEVLDVLAEMVHSTIIKEMKNKSLPFWEMRPKTMSVVVQNQCNGEVKESFLHFEALEQLVAGELTKKMVTILEHYGLEYRENVVGEAYDGALVMRGEDSGVQARLKECAEMIK